MNRSNDESFLNLKKYINLCKKYDIYTIKKLIDSVDEMNIDQYGGNDDYNENDTIRRVIEMYYPVHKYVLIEIHNKYHRMVGGVDDNNNEKNEENRENDNKNDKECEIELEKLRKEIERLKKEKEMIIMNQKKKEAIERDKRELARLQAELDFIKKNKQQLNQSKQSNQSNQTNQTVKKSNTTTQMQKFGTDALKFGLNLYNETKKIDAQNVQNAQNSAYGTKPDTFDSFTQALYGSLK